MLVAIYTFSKKICEIEDKSNCPYKNKIINSK